MEEPLSIEPHENDVLMGRGGLNNKHSGNEKLRQLARQYGSKYKTLSKKEKSDLSRYLVRRMRELDPPARFLKRVQQTAVWEEVGDDIAREKASQVLRDAVSGLLDQKQTTDELLPTVSAQTSTDVDEQHHEYESPQSMSRFDAELRAAVMPDEEASSSAAFNPVPYPPPPSHQYQGHPSPPSAHPPPPPPYQLHPSSHHHHHIHQQQQPPPPPPPLSETPPERKRRRYSAEEPMPYTTPSSSYSPIRRHNSENTYILRRPPRVSRHRSASSTDEMGQLLSGELLESDSEDDPVIPPRSV